MCCLKRNIFSIIRFRDYVKLLIYFRKFIVGTAYWPKAGKMQIHLNYKLVDSSSQLIE